MEAPHWRGAAGDESERAARVPRRVWIRERGSRCPSRRSPMSVNISVIPAANDLPGQRRVASGFKVDLSHGERVGRVSSEWFSRPHDERYLSLSELYAAVRARAERATARTVESRAVRVEASRGNAERLALFVPGRDAPIAPTHWSFGQLCSLEIGRAHV